ncbi:isocitrate lyase/phosphoenolpyruvate mutase family protein [Planosporangium thailandense]|uniref:Isocitrate lyase/phosphoenolpyruvate mutase family protein n=1 Tax=Planosporangium thailandense TaxID=765197 RepID=A0ABX0Y3Y7_9ACTN|nr:isocitrate lyase/phosphoenolpyruvate mutase family protein [Planosporangium thailandense]NJC73101.1 isocitrate lyase/phosphoenolpyruvate mutase family protein [Planosporangium thailandense]
MDTARFRALHHGDQPLLLPNVWDYASAAALAARGFPALGTTSLGVAAAVGEPDATGATRDDTLRLAERLSRLPVLLTVDIEGGFSDRPEEVAAFGARLRDTGVVGINVEDGRPDDTLAPVDHHYDVVAAVKERVPELFVNARTDVYWLAAGARPTPDEAIARASAYVRAGADGVFVPGLPDDAVAAMVAAVPAPLNVLYRPGGPTYRDLAAFGVRRISYGSLLFRAALQAAVAAAVDVAEGRPAAPDAPSYADVQHLIMGGPADA